MNALNHAAARLILRENSKHGRVRVTPAGWREIEDWLGRRLAGLARDANGHQIDAETVRLSLGIK